MDIVTASIKGADGFDLAAEITGAPDAMPVLLAHGGGEYRRAWKRVTTILLMLGIAQLLLTCAATVTARGPCRAYEIRDFAADLVALASWMDRKPALVGASLGGLAGLLARESSPTAAFRIR